MANWDGSAGYYQHYVAEPTRAQFRASRKDDEENPYKRGEFKFTEQSKKAKIVPQITRLDKDWHVQSYREMINTPQHPKITFGDFVRDLLGFVGVDGDKKFGITSNIKDFQFIILKNFTKNTRKKPVEMRQGLDRYTKGARYVLRVWPSQGK